MESHIILVAETGSDLTARMAEELGIVLVPMHVSLGDRTLDDGAFPAEDVCAYYDKTGKVPQTSGSTPNDFVQVFDELHQRWPEKKILHLAYSAITTCSYNSALMAAEGRDYVTSVDTKHVSVGQAAVVIEVARLLKERPEITLEEAAEAARQIAKRTYMSFIPKNLDYLRAGGRCSNVAALTGNLLGLHPCIEVLNGCLLAKKKYRGAVEKVIPKLVRDHTEKYNLSKEQIYFIWSTGLTDQEKAAAEAEANACGFKKITWIKTGCVITSHCGPGSFGVVGFAGE